MSLTRIKNHWFDTGSPVGKPFSTYGGVSQNDTYFDTTLKELWIFSATGWIKSQNVYAPPATAASNPTIKVGTVTTGDPSTSASVTNVGTDLNAIFNFVIPKGDKGDKGDSGTSSGGGATLPGFVIYNNNIIETTSQILVSGTGTNITVAQTGASYPGIGILGTDLYDWANLQYANYLGSVKKKVVISSGQFNVHKTIDPGKNNYTWYWDGCNSTTIVTQNNNVFSVIAKPSPTDNNDANIMIQATNVVKNIRIMAQSNQIGLEPGPSYGSLYENIRVQNAKSGIHLRFNLNARVVSCDGGTCTNGFIADIGNWTGATNSNSQSNHTSFEHCHLYHGTQAGGEVGFGIYASSGCKIISCIIEGGKYKKSIDFDFKMSTVVKDFTINGTHFETVYGNSGASSGEAYIFLRGVGIIDVKGIFSQYAGCLYNASGYPGTLQIITRNVPWIVPPADGKIFYNAGNTQWTFRDNPDSNISNMNTMSGLFAGTPVARCQGYQCGNNKWEMYGFGINSYNSTAARVAEVAVPEPVMKYRLTLKGNKEVIQNIKSNTTLRSEVMSSIIAGLSNIYVWEFETASEAEIFAANNPDFDSIITEI